MEKEKDSCLNPECGRNQSVRGLCQSCYSTARGLVAAHLTSWSSLEDLGKCLPAQTALFEQRRQWFLDKVINEGSTEYIAGNSDKALIVALNKLYHETASPKWTCEEIRKSLRQLGFQLRTPVSLGRALARVSDLNPSQLATWRDNTARGWKMNSIIPTPWAETNLQTVEGAA